ncbi:MAG: hypothetical protein ACK4FW_07850, partial [Stenotrophomonas sp.]
MNKTSSVPTRVLSLQFKLLGALSLGLAIVVLCALAGLASAWLNLSTDVPPAVARNAQAELLQREFRLQVQEWKNVLIRGSDEAGDVCLPFALHRGIIVEVKFAIDDLPEARIALGMIALRRR